MLSTAGNLGVLLTNLVLRPLAYRINRVSTESESGSSRSSTVSNALAAAVEEAHIRALLLQNVSEDLATA